MVDVRPCMGADACPVPLIEQGSMVGLLLLISGDLSCDLETLRFGFMFRHTVALYARCGRLSTPAVFPFSSVMPSGY